MATPVTKAGDIDVAAVERIVDNMASHQCAPLIMGTTGEGNSCSIADGVAMVSAAKRAAKGRVTIYVGLPGTCISDQRKAATEFIAAGADVILPLTPPSPS